MENNNNNSATGYRGISRAMSQTGKKINHASARNLLIKTLTKFAMALTRENNLSLSRDQIKNLVCYPHFQKYIGDILHILENQNKK